jgi:hypothetical protein
MPLNSGVMAMLAQFGTSGGRPFMRSGDIRERSPPAAMS